MEHVYNIPSTNRAAQYADEKKCLTKSWRKVFDEICRTRKILLDFESHPTTNKISFTWETEFATAVIVKVFAL